ncbi:hypothetical protein [Allostreptomyces psammosilenae]|uniref:Uncharacterized protein n=1 Tax=Allostreptomyces psammosilenae TaxID=1892865 RepID=A0A853A4B7_9ACTN|nr:hypothetical protein [Allostreptomyces psammosilenae]NYI05342.1 hypothetical protein [Allostreptomyces psammosilenae]
MSLTTPAEQSVDGFVAAAYIVTHRRPDGTVHSPTGVHLIHFQRSEATR